MSSDKYSRHVAASPFRDCRPTPDGSLVLDFRLSDSIGGRIIRSGSAQPARRVKPGWHERPTTTLVVAKAVGRVEAESGLEADAYRAFALDPTIVSYQVQPITIEYDDGARVVSTFPDLELRHADGAYEIVQIKSHATYLKHLDKNPRFRAEESILRHFGWRYRVLTEREIRKEPNHANTRLLWHYLPRQVAEALKTFVLGTVRSARSVKVGELVNAAIGSSIHEADIYALIAQGVLRTDPSKPIGPSAEVIVAN
jgi:hypothetical protein